MSGWRSNRKTRFPVPGRAARTSITSCPDALWTENAHGHPLWKRVLHALESVDYRFNDFGPYRFTDIGRKRSPEFDVIDTEHLSRDEAMAYFCAVQSKCARAFAELTDARLGEISATFPKIPVLDALLAQLRHLSLTTGRCNEALAAAGVATCRVGYGE